MLIPNAPVIVSRKTLAAIGLARGMVALFVGALAYPHGRAAVLVACLCIVFVLPFLEIVIGRPLLWWAGLQRSPRPDEEPPTS